MCQQPNVYCCMERMLRFWQNHTPFAVSIIYRINAIIFVDIYENTPTAAINKKSFNNAAFDENLYEDGDVNGKPPNVPKVTCRLYLTCSLSSPKLQR